MNILYITQYFPPEMGAPSARVHELSRYWTELGHSVTVLTTFPNYPSGVVYEKYRSKIWKMVYREKIDGINVIRAWSYPTHLRSSVKRGLNYASFCFSSALTATFLKGFDVVISTSPPPFLGLTGLYFSRLTGTPLVFEVRDLWPEVIPAMGVAGENSLTYRLFDKLVSALYEKSAIIVAVTESFRMHIAETRGIPIEKIKVIENAVDTDLFRPQEASPQLSKELHLDDKFVVSYVGTIGLTHGVGVVVEAAKALKNVIPGLVFLLVGDGYEKDGLERKTRNEGLTNILFLGRQPREKIPLLINLSDISLVLSGGNPILGKTIFAKVFEPMACGKPIIVGAEGETKQLVVDKGKAGISIAPESGGELIEAIKTLYNSAELRKELGDNGRQFVTSEYSRKKKAKDYIQILESIKIRHRA